MLRIKIGKKLLLHQGLHTKYMNTYKTKIVENYNKKKKNKIK